jgi:hypothetical protein
MYFVPGQYIQGQLMDNVLSIPKDSPESLPRVMKSSLEFSFMFINQLSYPTDNI